MTPLEDLQYAQAKIATWKNNPHDQSILLEAKEIMERYLGQTVHTFSASGMGATGELREVITDVAGLRLRFPGVHSYQPFVHRMLVFEVIPNKE